MIEFKLINYNLYNIQWEWTWEEGYTKGSYEHNPIIPGDKVCSTQKLSTIGVITSVSDKIKEVKPYSNQHDQTTRLYVTEVTVLWTTGPRKGKYEIKETKNLTNFTAYKEAVAAHLKEVEGFEAESNKFGL